LHSQYKWEEEVVIAGKEVKKKIKPRFKWFQGSFSIGTRGSHKEGNWQIFNNIKRLCFKWVICT
jgi:hypothetical protein